MSSEINKRVNHSVTENIIWNGFLKLFSVLFPLITFPYATRCLGAESLGRVTFVGSIISYFTLCANLGIPTYGIRACSKIRDDQTKLSKTVHEIFIINTVTTVLSYGVLFSCIALIPWFKMEKELILVSSITIGFSCIGVDWLYSAIEEYRYITIRSFFVKIISLLVLFIFVKDEDDYIAYACVTSIASVGSNVFNLVRLKKIIILHPIGNYQFKKHLKPILTFFATTIAVMVYTNIDTAMLGFLSNNTEVGYYAVAVKLKTVLLSVITSVGVILLPRITYYMSNNQTQLATQLSAKSLHMILVISTPLVLFFEINCKTTINIIAGAGYEPATNSMMILMPLLLVVGIANILVYQYILPRGMEQKYCVITVISASVDIIINLILIPEFGSFGVAVGTLTAEIIGLIIQIFMLKNDIKIIWKMINKLPIILSSVCASIINCILLYSIKVIVELNSLVQILISGTVFFVVYMAVLWLCKDEFIKELRSKLIACSSAIICKIK